METNFTKGKWIQHPRAKGTVISEETGRVIANCDSHRSNIDYKKIDTENTANSVLITAAPEMLQALKEELEQLEEWNGKGNYSNRIEKLKTLIEKATKI